MEPMYYIGLDVHKRKLSYCVKDSGGKVYAEGSLPATRLDLDLWMKTLSQPWGAAKKRKRRMLPLLSFDTGRRSQTQSSVQDARWSETANGSLVLPDRNPAEKSTQAAKNQKVFTPALLPSASGELLPS